MKTKSMWKENAWPAISAGILILSIFAMQIGLGIAVRPESLEFIPLNLPLPLRVLAGIGGVAFHAGSWLNYYRAIGRI